MENNYQKAARKRAAKELETNPNKYRELGSKGGRARVPKGIATLTKEERQAISKKGQQGRIAAKALRETSSDEQVSSLGMAS